jgi:hypothetical protein
MGITSWFRKARTSQGVPARPVELDPTEDDEIPFACSTCGRTDLPEAGDWDPPICLECDAAINEDAIREQQDSFEHD